MDKQLKAGVVLSYSQIIANNIISFIYTPLMILYLGKNQYGLFSFVNAIISYIAIMDMGFSSAVIRFNSKYIAEKNKKKQSEINGTFLIIFSIIAMLALVCGLIIYCNINFIWGNGFTDKELVLVHKMLLIAIISLAISFPLNVFNGIILANERFIFNKLLNLIKTILLPLTSILFLVNGADATLLLIISLVFSVLNGLINIFYCFIKLHIKISFKTFEWETIKTISKYSFYILLSMVAGQLYVNTDQLILGAVVGSAPLAIYNISAQFNNYFQTFSNFGSGIFLPKLTKIVVAGDKEKLMELLLKTSRIQLYICLYIYIGFICFGRKFIQFWVGKDFGESYVYACILMLPYIFSIIQSLFATTLEAMNKHKIKSLIYLLVAILNVIISLILVQPLGVLGCVVGTCIGMFVNLFINNIYYHKVLRLDIINFWKNITKPFMLIVIYGVISYVVFPIIEINNLWMLIVNVILFTILYMLMIWRFVLKQEEKTFFVQFIKLRW